MLQDRGGESARPPGDRGIVRIPGFARNPVPGFLADRGHPERRFPAGWPPRPAPASLHPEGWKNVVALALSGRRRPIFHAFTQSRERSRRFGLGLLGLSERYSRRVWLGARTSPKP